MRWISLVGNVLAISVELRFDVHGGSVTEGLVGPMVAGSLPLEGFFPDLIEGSEDVGVE